MKADGRHGSWRTRAITYNYNPGRGCKSSLLLLVYVFKVICILDVFYKIYSNRKIWGVLPANIRTLCILISICANNLLQPFLLI
jgi:hypothetical protein